MTEPGKSAAAARLSRRRLMLLGGAGMAALAGCGGLGDGGDDGNGGDDSGNGATPELPDEITFLHYETDDERQTEIESIASDWTEESGVDVGTRVVPEADMPTEITSAVASNTLPAVAELSNRALYSARDAIAPDSPSQVVEDVGEDSFYDNVLRLVSTGDGDYYGVPLYTWQQLTLYRESVRDEMGLPEPTDWESFEEFAEAVHDPDNDVYGCLLGSDQSQFTLQCFQPFALANDAHVFDEDGNIVFDEDPMVEALEFYARMASEYNPPGDMGPGDIDPVWSQEQVHLYSSNTMSFYFEAAFTDADTVEGFGVVPYVEREQQATFGEVVSTTTFDVDDGAQRASRDFQSYLQNTEGGADSPYYRWLHMQTGLFNPVKEGILDDEEYLDHDVIRKWPDEWHEEVIPTAIENMDRFGFRGDQVFPEIGQITGEFLITDAIRQIIDGGDPEQVASETADEMRDTIE